MLYDNYDSNRKYKNTKYNKYNESKKKLTSTVFIFQFFTFCFD